MKIDLKNIVLEDQNGKKTRFEFVTKLEVDGREYFIVVPKDNNDSEEAIVLKIHVDEKGSSLFETVEDEEEFSNVVGAYEMTFEDNI
jgi:uncharacterized protein YrzB (UPF0473 family)